MINGFMEVLSVLSLISYSFLSSTLLAQGGQFSLISCAMWLIYQAQHKLINTIFEMIIKFPRV